MTIVYIPHGGSGRGPVSDEPGVQRVGRVEHYSCGAAGLASALAVVFLAYPLLLAFTQPLRLLSTTAIVFVFVVLWFVTWAAFEVAWEWKAGRLCRG